MTYWEERATQNALKEFKYADRQAELVTRWFNRAKKELQKAINDFYRKFGDGENITYQQAKQVLNNPRLLNTALEDYYVLLEQLPGDDELLRQLKEITAKRAITRLEYLRMQLDLIVADTYIKYDEIALDTLTKAYSSAYYKAHFDYQQFNGYGNSFNLLSVNQILAAVSTNWSGKNYSERLYNQRGSLARRLNRIITTGMITGRSNKQMTQQLLKEMDISIYNARRLIRTEVPAVTEAARTLTYKQNGTRRYRYIATLDLLTSEICRELDGQVFAVKDKQSGVNAPPMHPHCRSTTCPEVEDGPDDTRAARDEDGNTYRVPADMTFTEWYDKYVKNNPEALLQEKCLKNVSADNRQFKKYKSILGKEMPKTLEDFQQMKYTEDTEYSRLKWDYSFVNRYGAMTSTDLVPYNDTPQDIGKKLLGYSLNPLHPIGQHKAKVFKSALGFDLSSAAILEQEIKRGLLRFRPIKVENTQYGTKYTVKMLITGVNGNKQPVITAWQIDNNANNIRMVTAYVEKDNTRP